MAEPGGLCVVSMTDVIEAVSASLPEERTVSQTEAEHIGGPTTIIEPQRHAGPATVHARSGWRRLARPTLYYLCSRAVVLVAALVAGAWSPTLNPLQSLGSAWDGRWYLLIAQHGYPHRMYQEGLGSRWAFFPAFPAAIRGVAAVTRLSPPDAAVAAAFIFGLTATIALWLCVRELFGHALAGRATLLFVFFPLSCTLSFAYTEGLFLTAAAGALFALQRKWWITAALLACVAGLTRITGLVVVLCVLVVVLPVAWRERRARPALAAAIAPVGFAGFMLYSWTMVGTPVAFLSSERFWQGQHFVWFRTPVDAVLSLVTFGARGMTLAHAAYCTAAVAFVCVGIVCLLELSRTRGVPSSWWIYTIGTVAIAFSAFYSDSIPRYAMVAFPLLVAIAWHVRSAARTIAVTALCACLQGILTVVFLIGAAHLISPPFTP
jgi:hypothetical protein